MHVVCQQDEDDLANDPGGHEEEHGQLPAEHVTPGTDVEGEEDGKEWGDHLLVNVELGDLEIRMVLIVNALLNEKNWL